MRDDERLALAERALGDGGGDALEAVVVDGELALTRYTRSAIHQNLDETSVTVNFRAVVDGRAGFASTSARDESSLRATAAKAAEQARFAPKPAVPVTLPKPAAYAPPEGAFDRATASATPEVRANAAAAVFNVAEEAGAWAAGYVATSRDAIAIANTNGLRAAFSSTDSGVNVKCIATQASGFAETYSRRFGALDAVALARSAASKARDAGELQSCDVGEWTVVAEPPAVGELLRYLLPHFSAQRVDEGGSFVSDGLDRRYVGENVSLVDDYAHPLHAGRPFDSEGTPTQRVALLENGVARSFVTDTEWAARLGLANTGHYAPEVGYVDGPQPRYPVVAPGKRTRDELIASTKRGILISRCWYIRVVDQRKTIVTGMTRDGTFLIENGRITSGLRNLRFNVNILGLLNACE
ncbi:MAG: TldD/PmbA family protein, partial [Candidatus Eremiobacteraeota bacterium]|nr:TldD/PmbA family protein [Candidatus Eremiobacteraeota bacterium]